MWFVQYGWLTEKADFVLFMDTFSRFPDWNRYKLQCPAESEK